MQGKHRSQSLILSRAMSSSRRHKIPKTITFLVDFYELQYKIRTYFFS